jgi:hypothetical protein
MCWWCWLWFMRKEEIWMIKFLVSSGLRRFWLKKSKFLIICNFWGYCNHIFNCSQRGSWAILRNISWLIVLLHFLLFRLYINIKYLRQCKHMLLTRSTSTLRAVSTGVLSSIFLVYRNGPNFKNHDKIPQCPNYDRKCTGVFRSKSFTSIFAPLETRTLMISICPLNFNKLGLT